MYIAANGESDCLNTLRNIRYYHKTIKTKDRENIIDKGAGFELPD